MRVSIVAVTCSHTWQFYYVDLFLNVYGVDSYWFYMAEILYMIWNAINDPLCVWLQDHSDLGGALLSVCSYYVSDAVIVNTIQAA